MDTLFRRGSNTPWQSIGHQIDTDAKLNPEEAVAQAGADFEVGLKNLFTSEGQKVSHRASYRKDTGDILGVVGPRWKPYQNIEMARWFQPWLDSGEVEFDTGGILGHGEKVWFLCTINRDPSVILPGDEIAKHLMLSQGHDGWTAIHVGFTPVRIVCSNMLGMALSHKENKMLRVKHTSRTTINMEIVRDIINVMDQRFEANAEQLRLLANKSVNQKDVEKYVRMVFKIDPDKPRKELHGKTLTILDKVLELVDHGKGQNHPKVRGTMYAAYNGVTEYLNYNMGRNESNRLNSLWFGPNKTLSVKALDLALTMVG
jgi:phage/plasmid-like protein (TIGR03299 family)